MHYFAFLFFLLSSGINASVKTSATIDELEKNGAIISPTNDGGWRIEFQLSGRDLNDDGLKPIESLKNVRILNLRDTKITNDGIKYIKGIKNLKRLHLERTQIDDECIDYLVELQELEYLNLYSTKVTDTGLTKLKELKNLKQLYVCLLYTSPSPRDRQKSRMPSSA